MVEGCVNSPTRVNVALLGVGAADDTENFPREVAERDALDAGMAPGGKVGACVVTVDPLRLTTEVNEELGD